MKPLLAWMEENPISFSCTNHFDKAEDKVLNRDTITSVITSLMVSDSIKDFINDVNQTLFCAAFYILLSSPLLLCVSRNRSGPVCFPVYSLVVSFRTRLPESCHISFEGKRQLSHYILRKQ